MSITRRRFVGLAARAAEGIAVWQLTSLHPCFAAVANAEVVPAPTGEWIALTPATAYRPYRSKRAATSETRTWVQVDLGALHLIDGIKLYPVIHTLRDEYYVSEGFPLRFMIEVSDTSEFRDAQRIVDHSKADFQDPVGQITYFAIPKISGRYIRLTSTRLSRARDKGFLLALAKMGIFSHGQEVSALRPVTADLSYGSDADIAQVTRPARPLGEGVVTDYLINVTPPSAWKPVAYKANAPQKDVDLEGGIFQVAMEDNIRYLLNSYTVDELLREFRDRAGIPNPAGLPPPKTKLWEHDLAGSNAGRFLMGAGTTLRWIDHPELRRRLNAVVEGIGQCRQSNGYIMGYPEDTIFFSERGAYTRAWLTHGLIEAGYAGNEKAFELLRGYYDWFNKCSYLPYMLRFAKQGGQGMIANTRLYFTPVGKPLDIQVIQQYFQENYWLDHLSKREGRAVWQYPYDRPHCYLLTNLEAYLDLYRATGDPHYFDAVKGGWELFHNSWEYPGGSIAIIEFVECPPNSYLLRAKLGELCGSVFWALLNQRFQLLRPDEESYVAEIEKSIYNVALANQAGSQGFRYHASLTHRKEEPTEINKCCEGQGTRLIGSLPEYIYTISPDSIYVNLFEPSTITWAHDGAALRLTMNTSFPFEPEVQLRFSSRQSARLAIWVRIASWAAKEIPVSINGAVSTIGQPGTFVRLDRTWTEGDRISFTLPMAFRLTRYAGTDQIPDESRYALEYGPFLMAAVGSPEVRLQIPHEHQAEDLPTQLRPKPGQPLHFSVEHNPGIEYMPYWQVSDQSFSCFPVIERRGRSIRTKQNER